MNASHVTPALVEPILPSSHRSPDRREEPSLEGVPNPHVAAGESKGEAKSEEKREAPAEENPNHLCPITMEPMQDPVLPLSYDSSTGELIMRVIPYERAAIREAFDRDPDRKEPSTRFRMTGLFLTDNTLRNIIQRERAQPLTPITTRWFVTSMHDIFDDEYTIIGPHRASFWIDSRALEVAGNRGEGVPPPAALVPAVPHAGAENAAERLGVNAVMGANALFFASIAGTALAFFPPDGLAPGDSRMSGYSRSCIMFMLGCVAGTNSSLFLGWLRDKRQIPRVMLTMGMTLASGATLSEMMSHTQLFPTSVSAIGGYTVAGISMSIVLAGTDSIKTAARIARAAVGSLGSGVVGLFRRCCGRRVAPPAELGVPLMPPGGP